MKGVILMDLLRQFNELELVELFIFAVKLLIVLICWAIIASFPLVPKVVSFYIKKHLAKQQVPSVNYLPDGTPKTQPAQTPPAETPKADDPVATPQTEIKESISLEDQMKRLREEKARRLGMLPIEQLRKAAQQCGKDGYKIKGYYKFDKPSLIEAIIQTQELMDIDKANDDAQEITDKAKENETAVIDNELA